MLTLLLASLLAPASAPTPPPPHRARGNLVQYFTADDYPPAAARRGVEGTVGIRFQVDKHGRVVRCDVTRSAGDPALDAATCAIILSRAQLEPARDARGQAVADTMTSRVNWRLPPDSPDNWLHPPAVMVMWMTQSGDQAICRLTINGREIGSRACGQNQTALVRTASLNLHAPAAVVRVDTFELDIAPAPAPDLTEAGRLVLDETARIVVAPDGRLADCRISHAETHDPVTGIEGTGFDPCGLPDFIQVDFAHATGGVRRSGRIRTQLYIRALPQGTPSGP